jgi:hypothetical protein
MYHPFSIAETLATAWSIFKKHFVTIIVYSVVTFFILLILGFILGLLFMSNNYYVDKFVSLVILFFQAYTTLGLYKLIFTLIDSDYYEFHISQIFPRFTMLISYIVVVFIIATIFVTYKFALDHIMLLPLMQDVSIIAGVLAFLYVVLRIMFFNSFIVDEDSGPIESLKQSFELTRGNFLNILAILGISILLIAVPAILAKYFILAPFFIIFSYPFVNIFLAVTYRKLIYSHKDVDELDSETV